MGVVNRRGLIVLSALVLTVFLSGGALAPTTLDPDTENLVKGSGTWTFPGDLTTDNTVYVDPAEADQTVNVDTYIYPTGGGTYANGYDTQNAGCSATTHWDCVEEVWPPDDATSYVIAATTTNDKESQTMGDLTITPGFTDIDLTHEFRCSGAGSGTAGGDAYQLVVVGAEEYQSALRNCPAAWTTFTDMRETSPSGDEWTAADVNAVECGYVSGPDLAPDNWVTACRIRVQVFYPADYELEYQVGWTGETCAQARTLRVSAHMTNANGETILLQVDDGSESAFTTRITITATSDPSPTYQTYALTDGEWDTGGPLVRFIGSSESGDTTQTTLNVDDLEIECADPPGGGTHNSLVDIDATVGTNCDAFAGTGQRIRSGLDDGDPGGTADDGILDDQEVDDTGYVCDGAPGADGADGANGADGADGSDGADGPPGPRGPPGESWFLLVIAALGLGGFIALARRNTDGE